MGDSLSRGKLLAAAAVLIGLYLTAFVNYLLFHSLVEIFSVVVAFSLFMIAWNSRRYIENPYLLFIGAAYLFIGFIDLMHTLSYKGMGIFAPGHFYANQLWIGARYMESISLLLAFYFLYRGRPARIQWVMAAYSAVTVLLIASVFYWRVFPECFIEGVGQTTFKKVSEYVVCGIIGLDILLLYQGRGKFERYVFHLLLWSLLFTILSEWCFTRYVDNYGLYNLIGHYFKLFSFYLVYRAIIRTGIEEPYELIFRDLDHKNKALVEEIRTRKMVEQQRETVIAELQKAMNEITTLRGILPLCSYCKRIRNDRGEWEDVDIYIHKHSAADISHGICPECMEKHYPEYT